MSGAGQGKMGFKGDYLETETVKSAVTDGVVA